MRASEKIGLFEKKLCFFRSLWYNSGMKQSFLELGRILSTHALSGEVKFEHWGDDDTVALRVKRVFLSPDGTQEMRVKKCRRHGKFLLYTFEGIDNVDDAALLRLKTVYGAREDLGLPQDTVFWADLIGEPVVNDETGEVYGVIRDIYNRGASDIWEIEKDGVVVLFAAADVFVKKLSPNGARILPPEGLFV